MVRYRRNFVPGATYFFTVALADRCSNVLTTHIDILRQAFRRTRAEQPFDIDAIVVLPDHLHAVLTLPEGDADFSSRWRHIKTEFTRSLIAAGAPLKPRESTGRMLWQRRFWEHTIRGGTDFSRHIDYIHYNPVKHGLVSAPMNWPYSSLPRFVRHGVLADDWGASPAEPDNFGEP